ncbi:rhamnosyltransferase [compost metagenome]
MAMISPRAAFATKAPVVVAVVISFNPNREHFEELIDATAAQTTGVVIVDNGSAGGCPEWLQTIASRQGITYEPLASNVGVAAAQNRGIELARQRGADYVLLMDHDSLPQEGMVKRLLEADLTLRASGVKLGAVGPCIVDRRSQRCGNFVRMNGARVQRINGANAAKVVECDFLIASGSLVRVDVFYNVGGMNNGYFVDHVDTEWCFRVRSAGYRIFGIPKARLLHSLGDDVVRVWLGRWREVAIHSPVRDYYMCRNTILMLQAAPMDGAWRWAHVSRLAQFVLFFGLGVAPRWRRLKLMATGLRHGLQGKDGPLTGA